jgi:hypothetical protein
LATGVEVEAAAVAVEMGAVGAMVVAAAGPVVDLAVDAVALAQVAATDGAAEVVEDRAVGLVAGCVVGDRADGLSRRR